MDLRLYLLIAAGYSSVCSDLARYSAVILALTMSLPIKLESFLPPMRSLFLSEFAMLNWEDKL